jgi:hypothetical protein
VESELRLRIIEDGADAERMTTLTRYLRGELAQLDVPEVGYERDGEVPEGARAIELEAVAGLLVTLGGSVESLRSVIHIVRGWVTRGEGAARTVRLELGGDVLQISNASAADQDKLIELFVDRHAPS